jgi:hypothetical protein
MFLYTNKAFMTDLGSNFVEAFVIGTYDTLFIDFTGTFIFGTIYTVKPVYKWYSKNPENVPFMGSCPLYTG